MPYSGDTVSDEV